MSDRSVPADPLRRTDVGEPADPLGPVVRALFSDLSLAGDATADRAGERLLCGEAGRIEHGTRVRFGLRVAGDRVREVRYRAYGCPYTLACCEWLARRLGGAQLCVPPDAPGTPDMPGAEGLAASLGTPADWATALGIPQARLGRLLVIEDALRAALGTGPQSTARRGRPQDGAPHDGTPAATSPPADDAMTKPG